MKNIKVVLLITILITLGSCKKYLDIVPDNVATLENAFTMRNTAERYLYTCYSYLPNEANLSSNPAFTGGDEVWFTEILSIPAWNIARGKQSVVSPEVNYWDGEKSGKPLFLAIRDCNIFLENIGKVPDMDDYEKERWIAEVKFLKAYYHFWLLRMYGPIPLIRENLPVSANVDEVKVSRKPVDECFDYIVQLIDEAAPDLPSKIENELSELGRITNPIALSIKARILVTAASPLFNGNADYANFIDKVGIHLFNSTYSADKWDKAVVACREAIDASHNAGFKLYYFHENIPQYQLSEQTKIQMSIRNSVCERWNSEVIWGNSNSTASAIQTEATPRGLDPAKASNNKVRANLAPTLKMVELFYTQNGVPIEEDKTWNYTDRYNLRTANENNKYHLKEGYTTSVLNFDREHRFYADLGFDGGIWYGQGRYDDNDPWYISAKKGQPASMQATNTFSVTGYWAKKLVHYSNVIEASAYTVQAYPWPSMRLADLYLLYAESLNEKGSYLEALKWANLVRERAGLNTIETSWTSYSKQPTKYLSKEGLREILQQERLIEMAFEGHRFWDLRRWKLALGQLNSPVNGWDVDQVEAADYYRQSLLFSQSFKLRDYFWPIKEKNLIVNKNLVQNPGW